MKRILFYYLHKQMFFTWIYVKKTLIRNHFAVNCGNLHWLHVLIWIILTVIYSYLIFWHLFFNCLLIIQICIESMFPGFFFKLTLYETNALEMGAFFCFHEWKVCHQITFFQLAKFYNLLVNAAPLEKFLRIKRRIHLIN